MLAALVHLFRANTRVPAPVVTKYVSAPLSLLDPLPWVKSVAERCQATSTCARLLSALAMTVDIVKDGKVPEDFVIASSARLQHISCIAKAAGLEEDEVIPHGLHKAKVSSVAYVY